jgi:hypothetical protein
MVSLDSEPQIVSNTAGLIAQVKLNLARHAIACSAFQTTLEKFLGDSQTAISRSNLVLAGCSSNVSEQSAEHCPRTPTLVQEVDQASDKRHNVVGLKKGDGAQLHDDGAYFDVIVVNVLSINHAIVRVMEGPLAGEEIEAFLDHSVMKHHRPAKIDNKIPQRHLRLIAGRECSES